MFEEDELDDPNYDGKVTIPGNEITDIVDYSLERPGEVVPATEQKGYNSPLGGPSTDAIEGTLFADDVDPSAIPDPGEDPEAVAELANQLLRRAKKRALWTDYAQAQAEEKNGSR
jgi:hypothetical protein